MKRIITLLSMFLFAGSILMAQTTQPKLSYGVVIRDAANNLLVNEPATVDVTIYKDANAPLYQKDGIAVTTDANGLLILSLGEDSEAWNSIDWSTAHINLNINCAGYTINHDEPVYAVPYALQAPNSDILTTDEIVRYISEINFQNDVRRILKAYHENTYGLEDGWVDTFKHYLMSHKEKIKEIVLSYAPRITASNINTTYSTIMANTAAYNKGVQVLKEFAKENVDAAIEIAQYYIQNYSAEYNEELQSLVNKIQSNVNIDPYIRTFLNTTFDEYFENHPYLQKTDCDSFDPCSLSH